MQRHGHDYWWVGVTSAKGVVFVWSLPNNLPIVQWTLSRFASMRFHWCTAARQGWHWCGSGCSQKSGRTRHSWCSGKRWNRPTHDSFADRANARRFWYYEQICTRHYLQCFVGLACTLWGHLQEPYVRPDIRGFCNTSCPIADHSHQYSATVQNCGQQAVNNLLKQFVPDSSEAKAHKIWAQQSLRQSLQELVSICFNWFANVCHQKGGAAIHLTCGRRPLPQINIADTSRL